MCLLLDGAPCSAPVAVSCPVGGWALLLERARHTTLESITGDLSDGWSAAIRSSVVGRIISFQKLASYFVRRKAAVIHRLTHTSKFDNNGAKTRQERERDFSRQNQVVGKWDTTKYENIQACCLHSTILDGQIESSHHDSGETCKNNWNQKFRVVSVKACLKAKASQSPIFIA